jgi:sugar phosphate isomerase/epimerase
MWRAHAQNDSPQAWKHLLSAMERALRIAGIFDVTLGVEPELANVINSASKARRLLDELKDPRLKIILDGANLLHASDLAFAGRIWQEAFDLLGTEICLAHAKDMAADGTFVAAGRGALDFDLYVRLLRSVNFRGPIILHGLAENEVSASVRSLKDKLAAVNSAPAAKGRP